MQDFMSKSARIRYVRYADDIAFAMLEGANSEMVSQGFKQFFNEALTELKLEATSLELVRGISKPCSTLVLGVLISIRPDRNLELRAPGSKKNVSINRQRHKEDTRQRRKTKCERSFPSYSSISLSFRVVAMLTRY